MRVSSRRARSDLTHWRPARFNGHGNGMWWNFGGIHREVSVRPVGNLDIVRAQALPAPGLRRLPRPGGGAHAGAQPDRAGRGGRGSA